MRRPPDHVLDKCDIHQSVLTECIDDLLKAQVFSKEDVLRRLHYNGIAAAVYWDYVRRKIENGGLSSGTGKTTELLPVSATFFKRRRKQKMNLNSLLAGPGGKAAGYALATIEDGKVALAAVTIWHNQKNGLEKASKQRGSLMADTLLNANAVIASQIRATVGLVEVETQEE